MCPLKAHPLYPKNGLNWKKNQKNKQIKNAAAEILNDGVFFILNCQNFKNDSKNQSEMYNTNEILKLNWSKICFFGGFKMLKLCGQEKRRTLNIKKNLL